MPYGISAPEWRQRRLLEVGVPCRPPVPSFQAQRANRSRGRMARWASGHASEFFLFRRNSFRAGCRGVWSHLSKLACMEPHESGQLHLKQGKFLFGKVFGLVKSQHVTRRKTYEFDPMRAEVRNFISTMYDEVQLLSAPRRGWLVIRIAHNRKLDRPIILGVRTIERVHDVPNLRQII